MEYFIAFLVLFVIVNSESKTRPHEPKPDPNAWLKKYKDVSRDKQYKAD